MTNKKPVIGILLDWQAEGSFSNRPHYALRQLYFDAIAETGGIGFGLPYDDRQMRDHIAVIDGLLCPGGNYASPQDWYIGGLETTYDASPRAAYEITLIRAMLAAGKPVLGICGGMQVLGASFGCRMVPDLHRHFDTEIDHKNGTKAEDFAFPVEIISGTKLHDITGAEVMRVNAAHKEAIVTCPEDVRISAVNPDGVIQAIEIPAYDFALGVQWHPEFFIRDDKGEPGHRRIFESLIAAAAKK